MESVGGEMTRHEERGKDILFLEKQKQKAVTPFLCERCAFFFLSRKVGDVGTIMPKIVLRSKICLNRRVKNTFVEIFVVLLKYGFTSVMAAQNSFNNFLVS